MKKVITILLILWGMESFSQAPTIQWQRSYGGSREENAYSVLQTADGGYIFCARTNSANGDVVGYQWPYDLFNGDVWVVKTDALGTIEWQKLYGGYSNDGGLKIINTSDGGYAIAAVSNSSNGTVVGHIGGYDYWILKLDAAGDLQWQKILGGSNDDYIRDIKQAADGGFIVIGYTSSSLPNAHGLKDAYVVKLTSAGVVQWWKVYGGSNDDLGSSICPTPDGGYVMVGTTKSINGDFMSNHGMSDAFLIKINATGTIEWQKTLGGTSEEFGQSIIIANDGNYVISAASSSSDGDVTGNRGSTDLWIIKTTTSGEIIWQKTFGGSSSDCYSESKVVQTSDGGFVACGSTISGNGDASGNHSSGSYDAWVVKMDSEGTKQWHRCFGGSAEDDAHTVIETSDRGYMIAGMSRTNVSGGNGTPDWTFNATRGLDAWMIKLNPDSFLSAPDQNASVSISLYPNPVTDILNVVISNNSIISKMIITDMLGKTVMEKHGNASSVNVQSLAKGVYGLQLIGENRSYKTKFIKQ